MSLCAACISVVQISSCIGTFTYIHTYIMYVFSGCVLNMTVSFRIFCFYCVSSFWIAYAFFRLKKSIFVLLPHAQERTYLHEYIFTSQSKFIHLPCCALCEIKPWSSSNKWKVVNILLSHSLYSSCENIQHTKVYSILEFYVIFVC